MTVLLEEFYREYQKAIDQGSAAVFAGAGFSKQAGYVVWKDLLREIAADLELDIDEETDLIAIAQYHINKTGSRAGVNEAIIDHFTKEASATLSHGILAGLPIDVIWTTNYDRLLEEAYVRAGKVVDTKYTSDQMVVSKPRSDVILYKMHGDVEHSSSAVLTKQDYENYDQSRLSFSMQLQGHMLSRTFVFIGFSFSDPNVGQILSRVKRLSGLGTRRHYWITRDEAKNPKKTERSEIRQRHQINDLTQYGIQTVLIDEWEDLQKILAELNRRSRRKNIFVSGSAAAWGNFSEKKNELCLELGRQLVAARYTIINGYGNGVGDLVYSGVLAAAHASGSVRLDEQLIIRPFPQHEADLNKRKKSWTEHRNDLLHRSGCAVFLFGNKVGPDGKIINADGVLEEFQIAVQQGSYPIPIGITGFVAEEIWNEVSQNLEKFYGKHALAVATQFANLNDMSKTPSEIVASVLAIVKAVAPIRGV